ncbi:hypothetical protein CA603_49190 [Paraburkholderia hospita]|nr:hypothetical protein CA603_49190 [Paraburkholderia hospita]
MVYEWEPCQTYWLESLVQQNGPNFAFQRWSEEHFDDEQLEAESRISSDCARPELYVSDPLLCADWEPVDEQAVEASCARVLGY